MTTMKTPQRLRSPKQSYGTLSNYRTGDSIRPATKAEAAASKKAARTDGGAGIIIVNGVPSFVS
jgi:hypothetical protein